MIVLFQLPANPVGTVLGARKNQNAVEICAGQKREQEVELLGDGDRIERVIDGFRRRAVGSNLDPVGIAKAPG